MNPEQKAIVVSAHEDYLSLGQAELECTRASIVDLYTQEYLVLLELEQDEKGTRELSRYDTDSGLSILQRADSWTPPLELGARFYAFVTTEKGEKAFGRIIGVKS